MLCESPRAHFFMHFADAGSLEMEDHSHGTGLSVSRVKATLQLGSESYSFDSESGILSQQLDAMKEKSMGILKEYITKHNVPNDVPDEPLEGSSEDDAEELNNPPKKSKKQNWSHLFGFVDDLEA